MSGVSDAITLVSDVMVIFTQAPMSYFLAMGLVAGGISLFARARKASGGKNA